MLTLVCAMAAGTASKAAAVTTKYFLFIASLLGSL
jgi:hypothetical protein